MKKSEYKEKEAEILEILRNGKKALEDLYIRACQNPPKLRAAKSTDIIEGAIVWHEWGEDWNEDENSFLEKRFVEVVAVIKPSDEWKAFEGDDGARRGLHGAFVEE